MGDYVLYTLSTVTDRTKLSSEPKHYSNEISKERVEKSIETDKTRLVKAQ